MRCFYILMCASVSVHVCFSAATCVRLWLCPKSFCLLFYVFTRISLCLYGCAHSSAVYIHLVCSVTLRIPFSITLTIHINAFIICSTNSFLFWLFPLRFVYMLYTYVRIEFRSLVPNNTHVCAHTVTDGIT